MVINPIKTNSVTIATRQKHQLSPLPLDLDLNGAKTDQVSEHRLLGITIDNKLRWDSHINNVCKTVPRRVFLLSKLRYIVDIDTRKLFTKEVNACTDDIKTLMTENQLKLNDDKTEALLFPFSSSLKHSTVSLPDSITLGSHNIPFSDSARNIGFILDSKLSMKKHIIKICQTDYFQH